jgi:hypothetical protein
MSVTSVDLLKTSEVAYSALYLQSLHPDKL